jgi:hypothetical protein
MAKPGHLFMNKDKSKKSQVKKTWFDSDLKKHRAMTLAGATNAEIIEAIPRTKDKDGKMLTQYKEPGINSKRYQLAKELLQNSTNPEHIAIVSAATRVPVNILTQDQELGPKGTFQLNNTHTPLPAEFNINPNSNDHDKEKREDNIDNFDPEDNLPTLNEEEIANMKVGETEITDMDEFDTPPKNIINKPTPSKSLGIAIDKKVTPTTPENDSAFDSIRNEQQKIIPTKTKTIDSNKLSIETVNPEPAPPKPVSIIPLEAPKIQIIETSVNIQPSLATHDAKVYAELVAIKQYIQSIEPNNNRLSDVMLKILSELTEIKTYMKILAENSVKMK